MGIDNDGKRYVSFAWLIGAFGGTMVVVVTITLATIGFFSTAMDKKVDKEIFEYVRNDIKEIKNVVKDNRDIMDRFTINQIRVMEKLGIPPHK